MLDVFKSDAFSLFELTVAINKLPYVPGRIGDLGLFQERGVTSTSVMVEEQKGKLVLVPTAARGTMPNVKSHRSREARVFKVPHCPLNEAVMADEVQGIRAFGTEDTTETVTQIVNDKLELMRQSHELTFEWHRVGAIKGVVLDADGTTEIYDLFDEFGLTQTEINIDLNDATTDVKKKAIDAKRAMENALGATPFNYMHVFCGDTFFDKLVSHARVEAAYERFQDGSFLRADHREGFEYPTGCVWENYRGQVGAQKFFDDEEAYCIPVGAPDLFYHWSAPAPFIETVNTVGQMIYAKQEVMKFDVGVELHTQSNPLVICTRPKCLIKLTMEAESSSA